MEVFEIRRREVQREGPPTSGRSWRAFFATVITVVAVMTATFLVISFVFPHESDEVINFTFVDEQDATAEKLHGAECEADFCNTEDCVKIAARILKFVNPKADPCVDLHDFSCGGNPNPLPDYKTTFDAADEAQARFVLDIRKIVENTENVADSATLAKMKQFYNSCVNGTQRDLDQMGDLRMWLEELGLYDYETTGEYTTWNALLSKLEGYQIHTLLRPHFKSSRGSSVDTIEVDCSMPFLSPDAYSVKSSENAYLLSLYREAMDSAFVDLEELYDKRQEFVRDVMEVETQVAAGAATADDTGTSGNHLLSDENILLLKQIWRPFVGDGVQELDVVSVCKFDLNSLLTILRNAPPKKSLRYVVWRMMTQVMPHFGANITQVNQLYMSQFSGWKYMYQQRWAQCAEFIRENLGFAATKELMAAGYMKRDIISKAQEIFEELKDNFQHAIKRMELNLVDNSTKKFLFEQVHSLKLNVGYHEMIDHAEMTDIVYKDLDFGDNYFQNVKNVKNFLSHRLFERLWYADPEKPSSQIPLDHSPLGTSASFDDTSNSINVDIGFLSPPMLLYTEHIPKYLQFGDVSLLAREIGRAISSIGYSEEGENVQTLDASNYFSEHLFNRMNATSPHKEMKKELLLDIYADIVSLYTTYEGLSKYLKEWKSDKLLPTLTLTKKQTYYVQAAQKYCGLRKEDSIINPASNLLSRKMRLNMAVANTEHFGDVFNCPTIGDSQGHPI